MMGPLNIIIFFVRFWQEIAMSIIRLLPPFRPKPKSIAGDIVLITGAGHGMGRIQAKEFSKLGATVVVVDLNKDGNEETADMIRETGGRVFAYTCDVSKKENVAKLATEVRSDVGDVSILVNNAGVIYVADFMSITTEKVQRTMDVNVLAHFWLIREFLPAMKKKNHGHIVSLASKAGVEGVQFMTDYCASKHAVVGLCESLFRELRVTGFDGVHVTYVCPTFVDTGFVKNPSLAVGRMPKPEEVVERLIDGVLHNKVAVAVPEDMRLMFFLRAILPRSVLELFADLIDPQCDKVDMKKTL